MGFVPNFFAQLYDFSQYSLNEISCIVFTGKISSILAFELFLAIYLHWRLSVVEQTNIIYQRVEKTILTVNGQARYLSALVLRWVLK